MAVGILLVLLSISPRAQGRALTLAELRALAQRTGFPDPDLAAAVAMAESSGQPWVTYDQGLSFGLWQIHWPDHREFDRLRLLDPAYNARAALSISRNGADWSPWTTYRTGDYRKWLPAPQK